MTRYSLTLLATLAAAPVWAPANAATPVDRRVDAMPNGTVEVHNVAGTVQIDGSDRREVHVTGTLADNVERLDVSSEGDRVVIRVVLEENSWHGGATSLTISAPRASALDVDTVSASIDVHGIEGEQRLASVSGRIDTEAFGDEMTVRSVSGAVNITGHDRSAMTRAQAVSGHVRLTSVAGEVQAESVSGRVDVIANTLDRAQLSSISGSVSLRTGLTQDSRIESTTTSGDIALTFKGDAAAEYDLATFSGDIRNCFGPAPTPARLGGPQRQSRFKEGNSKARVHANTMSGSIAVCRE